MCIYTPILYRLIFGVDVARLLHRREIQHYRQIFKSVFLAMAADDSTFFIIILPTGDEEIPLYATRPMEYMGANAIPKRAPSY